MDKKSQGKDKVRSKCKYNHNRNLMGFDIIEINLVLLQKLFSLVYNLRMSHKKWKLSSHLITKQPLSLSKIIIESKNIFDKSCSFWYAIWKVKFKLLYDHKALTLLLFKLIIASKNFCESWFSLICSFRMSHKKWKLRSHLVAKQSFQHILNFSLN